VINRRGQGSGPRRTSMAARTEHAEAHRRRQRHNDDERRPHDLGACPSAGMPPLAGPPRARGPVDPGPHTPINHVLKCRVSAVACQHMVDNTWLKGKHAPASLLT
jgi:hypothetical protein